MWGFIIKTIGYGINFDAIGRYVIDVDRLGKIYLCLAMNLLAIKGRQDKHERGCKRGLYFSISHSFASSIPFNISGRGYVEVVIIQMGFNSI